MEEIKNFFYKYCFDEEDYVESDKIINKLLKNNNILFQDNKLDLHGLTCDEVYWILEYIKNYKRKEKLLLITGLENNSKNKPIMDYYCVKEYRCKLHKYITKYLIIERIKYKDYVYGIELNPS